MLTQLPTRRAADGIVIVDVYASYLSSDFSYVQTFFFFIIIILCLCRALIDHKLEAITTDLIVKSERFARRWGKVCVDSERNVIETPFLRL